MQSCAIFGITAQLHSAIELLTTVLFSVPCFVAARKLPNDVHSVHVNVLIVQVSVPLPQRMRVVLEGQNTVTISWLTEC